MRDRLAAGRERSPDCVWALAVMRLHQRAQRLARMGESTAARFFDDASSFAELHFAESQQDVVLAREVVEEGAFADVGGFGDVFDRGFAKPFSAKRVESGAEQAFAKFRASALRGGNRRWQVGAGAAGRERVGLLCMTNIHK